MDAVWPQNPTFTRLGQERPLPCTAKHYPKRNGTRAKRRNDPTPVGAVVSVVAVRAVGSLVADVRLPWILARELVSILSVSGDLVLKGLGSSVNM